MKKIAWILAFMAAALILFSGCENDPGSGAKQLVLDRINLSEVFSGTGESMEKATVALEENGVTFTFNGGELWGELITPETTRWNASGYEGIKFEYKSTGNATIFIQDTDSIFIFATAGDGWGAIAQMNNWQELELPFSILQKQDWFGTDGHKFGSAPVIKLCFQISDDIPNDKKFEIRNFDAYKYE
jgi:hypothetical protein